MEKKEKLNIQFEVLPYTGIEALTPQTILAIADRLHQRFGHFAKEMNEQGGYFLVTTIGDSVIGNPVHKNVSAELSKRLVEAAYL